MKIHAFDTPSHFYHFELTELATEFHQHPAVEIIIAQTGNFSLATENAHLKNLTFAIIDQHIQHRVIAERANLIIKMLELPTPNFYQNLTALQIEFTQGIFSIERTISVELIIEKDTFHLPYAHLDSRIATCLQFFQQTEVNYQTMLTNLCARTHLSASRLSHLFKTETGISIKQYAVWNRLKKTIKLVLEQQLPLSTAAMQAGFYDAAHWNHAFKKYLGISPASVYNSRILQ